MINMAVGDEDVIYLIKIYFISQKGKACSLPSIKKVSFLFRLQKK